MTTDNSKGSGGPSTSSVLFFVALGFGICFIILWIVVGIRYCFRYNRRHRQTVQTDDVMAIDLVTTPPSRRHRRRKEKKLMTMDEVNELFPLMKYKVWRSVRASRGLSTSGGISLPASRAPSIKGEKEHSVPTVEIIEHVDSGTSSQSISSQSQRYLVNPETLCTSSASSAEDDQHLSCHRARNLTSPRVSFSLEQPHYIEPHQETQETEICEEKAGPRHSLSRSASRSSRKSFKSATATSSGGNAQGHEMEGQETATTNGEDNLEEQIQHAVSADYLDSPGDTCAVCLDSIEDDDDIRGLKCGHTFHASCIDPWLTARRACCPLCKADYYIPKPPPDDVTEPEPVARPSRRATRQRAGASTRYQPTNGNSRGPVFSSLLMNSRPLTSLPPAETARLSRESASRTPQQRGPDDGNPPQPVPSSTTSTRSSRIRQFRPALQRLINFGRPRHDTLRPHTHAHHSTGRHDPTPRQLESGQV